MKTEMLLRAMGLTEGLAFVAIFQRGIVVEYHNIVISFMASKILRAAGCHSSSVSQRHHFFRSNPTNAAIPRGCLKNHVPALIMHQTYDGTLFGKE